MIDIGILPFKVHHYSGVHLASGPENELFRSISNEHTSKEVDLSVRISKSCQGQRCSFQRFGRSSVGKTQID